MGYVYLLMSIVLIGISIAWVIGLDKSVKNDAWNNNEDDEFLKK